MIDGRLWVLCLLLAGSFPMPSQASIESSQQAQEKVEEFHDVLLKVMRSGDSYSQRYKVLVPVVDKIFDVDRIARISLGRTWRSLSVETKSDFAQRLMNLIAATYADRFASFNEQQFVTIEVRSSTNGDVVRTQLLRVDAGPVQLDYYLRDAQIFNVVADGVSDLSLRRADYNSIVKEQGFEALLEHLDRQIAQRDKEEKQ